MRIIGKLAITAVLALGLGGCASDMAEYSQVSMPRESGQSMVQSEGQKPLQCVPYARDHSGIKIYGDAYTWWGKAAGKYPRGMLPEAGTVMVLYNYAGPARGHVAVVRQVVSAREIRIDHANWLDDGSIYVNDPVQDVSSSNDWSAVRVFNLKTGGWGGKIYPVQGFIGGSAPDGAGPNDLVADNAPGGRMGATTLMDELY